MKEILTIGIIGFADVKDDRLDIQSHLNKSLFDLMLENAIRQIKFFKNKFQAEHVKFVSGGAAWSDHIAVSLYLQNPKLYSLTLYLPSEFDKNQFSEKNRDRFGYVSNRLHKKFSELIESNSLKMIAEARDQGAIIRVIPGFLNRNTYVARESNVLLAYTWGKGKSPDDGGTRDTWYKAKDTTRLHISIWDLYQNELF